MTERSQSRKATLKAQLQRKKDDRANRQHPDVDVKKAKRRAYMRQYFQRPDVQVAQRARRRAWYHAHKDDPKLRTNRRAYHQRPDVKAKKRFYIRGYFSVQT